MWLTLVDQSEAVAHPYSKGEYVRSVRLVTRDMLLVATNHGEDWGGQCPFELLACNENPRLLSQHGLRLLVDGIIGLILRQSLNQGLIHRVSVSPGGEGGAGGLWSWETVYEVGAVQA